MKQKSNRLVDVFFAGFLSTLFLFACTSGKQLTATASAEEITQAISRDCWTFTVNTVMPQSGQTRTANGIYDVQCNKDTVLVYLPYFGRSYSSSVAMNSKGPLDFQTSSFSYLKEQNKKGGWNITIKPKDNSEVQSLSFSLYENGSAQLNVLLTNRSPISYSGSVRPKK
jgi:hypothetical protein